MSNEELDKIRAALLDGVSELSEQVNKKRLDAVVYLYMMTAMLEDCTIKSVYERYALEDVVYDTLPEFKLYGYPNGMMSREMPYIEYSCGFKLVKRTEPLSIPDNRWYDIVNFLGNHLQKRLAL